MHRFGLSVDEQEQVWELWGTGRSLRAVARAIGCREQQLRRYVWSVGGRRPAPRRRAQVCLSAGEREEIRKLREENFELRRANEILKAASVFFGAPG